MPLFEKPCKMPLLKRLLGVKADKTSLAHKVAYNNDRILKA